MMFEFGGVESAIDFVTAVLVEHLDYMNDNYGLKIKSRMTK